MEQHIFYISIDYRGHHRKGAVIFDVPFKSIDNQNIGYIEIKSKLAIEWKTSWQNVAAPKMTKNKLDQELCNIWRGKKLQNFLRT